MIINIHVYYTEEEFLRCPNLTTFLSPTSIPAIKTHSEIFSQIPMMSLIRIEQMPVTLNARQHILNQQLLIQETQ